MPKPLFPWQAVTPFPLKRILKERKISIREAARLTGFDRTVIQDYCAGRSAPSWRALNILAESIGFSLGDLDGARRRRKAKVPVG